MTLRGDCDNCDRQGVELRHLDVDDDVEAWCGVCIKKKGDRENAQREEENRNREYRPNDKLGGI